MAIVYGLMGKRHSGKSTVAHYLQELYVGKNSFHIEFSDPIIAVANAWKRTWGAPIDLQNGDEELLATFFNLHLSAGLSEALDSCLFTYSSDKQLWLDDGDLKQSQRLFDFLRRSSIDRELYFGPIVSEFDKERNRALLQWLGGFLRSKLQDEDIWAAEVSYLIEQFKTGSDDLVTVGGVRFQSDADVIDEFDGQLIQVIRPDQISDSASADVTEVSSSTIKPNFVILNNSTKARLRQVVHVMFRKVAW